MEKMLGVLEYKVPWVAVVDFQYQMDYGVMPDMVSWLEPIQVVIQHTWAMLIVVQFDWVKVWEKEVHDIMEEFLKRI